mgnify:CR=1 FL=1
MIIIVIVIGNTSFPRWMNWDDKWKKNSVPKWQRNESEFDIGFFDFLSHTERHYFSVERFNHVYCWCITIIIIIIILLTSLNENIKKFFFVSYLFLIFFYFIFVHFVLLIILWIFQMMVCCCFLIFHFFTLSLCADWIANFFQT